MTRLLLDERLLLPESDGVETPQIELRLYFGDGINGVSAVTCRGAEEPLLPAAARDVLRLLANQIDEQLKVSPSADN